MTEICRISFAVSVQIKNISAVMMSNSREMKINFPDLKFIRILMKTVY
jgi:hypothetical protein